MRVVDQQDRETVTRDSVALGEDSVGLLHELLEAVLERSADFEQDRAFDPGLPDVLEGLGDLGPRVVVRVLLVEQRLDGGVFLVLEFEVVGVMLQSVELH